MVLFKELFGLFMSSSVYSFWQSIYNNYESLKESNRCYCGCKKSIFSKVIYPFSFQNVFYLCGLTLHSPVWAQSLSSWVKEDKNSCLLWGQVICHLSCPEVKAWTIPSALVIFMFFMYSICWFVYSVYLTVILYFISIISCKDKTL